MIIPAMVARWLALGIWALVAASAVFWGSRLLVKPTPAPAHATTVSATAALRGDPVRLFGEDVRPAQAAAAAPVVPVDTRFKLVGVVAARQPAQGGIALIAVDGKPARAYRVGATVEGETVLLAVNARGADLGPRAGSPSVALQIPPLPAPTTGSLPPAASNVGGMVVPAPAPMVGPAGVMLPPAVAVQGQPTAAPGVPILPPASQDEPPAAVGSPVPGAGPGSPTWRPTPATR